MSEPPAAMVLAAGRGTRLGSLGESQAKAMVSAGGEPLVDRALRRLQAAKVRRCVINLHHLGEQIESHVGDGSSFGLEVSYSREQELLDVGGGIANALALLGERPFIVVNVDILTDYDLSRLVSLATNFGERLGHLVLGNNPDFRPDGDFCLSGDKVTPREGSTGHTYIGNAVYAPQMFASVPSGQPFAMYPLFEKAMQQSRLTGELHEGYWIDAGSPERLAAYDGLPGETASNNHG